MYMEDIKLFAKNDKELETPIPSEYPVRIQTETETKLKRETNT